MAMCGARGVKALNFWRPAKSSILAYDRKAIWKLLRSYAHHMIEGWNLMSCEGIQKACNVMMLSGYCRWNLKGPRSPCDAPIVILLGEKFQALPMLPIVILLGEKFQALPMLQRRNSKGLQCYEGWNLMSCDPTTMLYGQRRNSKGLQCYDAVRIL